jgi:hypothetical protein
MEHQTEPKPHVVEQITPSSSQVPPLVPPPINPETTLPSSHKEGEIFSEYSKDNSEQPIPKTNPKKVECRSNYQRREAKTN